MSDPEPAPSLGERILSTGDRELQLLAADGALPLPTDELLPIQVTLAGSADPEVAERARRGLAAIDPRLAVAVLASTTSEAALRHFALDSSHPLTQEAVLRRRDVPRDLLVEMARWLEPDLQEILLLRQDAIAEAPEILDALASNPVLSPFARRRLGEYREHLLAGSEPLPSDEPATGPGEATEEEVVEAIRAAAAAPAVGELDPVTGLSEAQLRGLPVPVRLKLSRGAPRTLRGLLIRDPNPQVALSTLRYNTFADAEIETVAGSRTVITDVLEAICRSRAWCRRYPVVAALVKNPRTPVGRAVQLCAQLAPRDLRTVGRDHNVSDAVRSTARRLYKIKTG